jgi:hypothetical protein
MLRTDIFSLFSPSPHKAKKGRKNIIHLSKSFYRTISFVNGGVNVYHPACPASTINSPSVIIDLP